MRGKQPKLSPRQQARLVEQRRGGEHTLTDLAEIFSISRATVYRVLERAQNADRQEAGGNTCAGVGYVG